MENFVVAVAFAAAMLERGDLLQMSAVGGGRISLPSSTMQTFMALPSETVPSSRRKMANIFRLANQRDFQSFTIPTLKP